MSEAFEGWAILELMGHRRLAGMVREVELFGAKMCRIDVPAAGNSSLATQFYGGAAIYCVTPTSEETARRVALTVQPAPVHRWELPERSERSTEPSPALDDDEDEPDEPDDIQF